MSGHKKRYRNSCDVAAEGGFILDIRICAYCCKYYSHELGRCTLKGLERIMLCPFGVQGVEEGGKDIE